MRRLVRLSILALILTCVLGQVSEMRAESQVLKVKLEINGRAIRKPKMKVTIYAGETTIKPTVIGGGFVVPIEVKRYTAVSVQFEFAGHRLFFQRVESFDFDANDWTVGLWDRVPFSPEIVLSEPQHGKKLKAIQYIKTNPKDRLGVVLAEQIYEKKR